MEHENIEYKGHTIVIENDEDPQNPRTEWDNLTEIHCCSSRYYLGEHNHKNWEDFNLMIAEAEKQNDFIVDVYAYIHGGTALSLGSFHGRLSQGHAQFDSGKCGVIIIRREKMLEEFGKKKWSKKLKQKAYNLCKGDIETFHAFLNNEVYSYNVDDYEDSCCGFYSIKEAMDEAKSVVDCIVEKDKKSHFEQLKIWIKNKVPFYARTTFSHTMDVVE